MIANDISILLRKLEDIDRRLDNIDREHAEDMESLRAHIGVLTESHKRCASRCWVADQEQLREAIRETKSDRPAIKDDKP
jgi:hypothetical protein